MQTQTNSPKTVSRRKFFKIAGLTAGGAAVACCGLSYAASQMAPAPEPTLIETPSYTYGKETNMIKRILVAYATKHGSTVQVASTIGEALSARGYAVDVKPIKENPSTEGYQAVIIGSAVNGANWLPEAVQYVKDHQQALNQAPLALFCVHAMNVGDDERSKKNRLAYLNTVRPLVKARAEAWFTGKGMTEKDFNPFFRGIIKKLFSAGEGDMRDWTKIRAWAEGLSLD